MSSTDEQYWVITASEEAYGPYDDFVRAYYFAWENLGFDGWTVTKT